jgi:glycosyltransferase involved in cell wall biosynthesis
VTLPPASPLVSFIVPCYNYAHFLPECVESILKLEGGFDWELLLIDDASTDGTAEVIQSFSDPRIRVIDHPVNLGHARTINEGLRSARGRFIARIDPDDRYRPSFLTAVIGKFEAFPEVGLVYGDVALIDERGTVTVERCDREHDGRDFKGNELVRLLERNFICAPSAIARREAWMQAAPVPEHLTFNDWYFSVMMARRHEFYYVDKVVAEYRVHGANHHTRIAKSKSEESSVFWVLDRVFATPEASPGLERAKRAARRRIYSAQYLDMANKYFQWNYALDSRRCYLAAMGQWPAYLARPEVLRRLAATYVDRRWYELSKAVVKRVLGPRRRTA